MTNWKLWALIVVIAALVIWYWSKTGGTLTGPANNLISNTFSQSGGSTAVVTSDLDSVVNNILKDATADQTIINEDMGEAALATFASQGVSDISQSYDENQF